jgi:hypothetical protein
MLKGEIYNNTTSSSFLVKAAREVSGTEHVFVTHLLRRFTVQAARDFAIAAYLIKRRKVNVPVAPGKSVGMVSLR